jgi:hypothetical protein
MDTLDLFGKLVCYDGEIGKVVYRSGPPQASRDHFAALRSRSVTIRIEGALVPRFMVLADTDLERMELVEAD